MTVFNAAVLRKGSGDLASALERNAQDALSAGARALRERHLKAVRTPEPIVTTPPRLRTFAEQHDYDNRLNLGLVQDEIRNQRFHIPKSRGKELTDRLARHEELQQRQKELSALVPSSNPFASQAEKEAAKSRNPFAEPSPESVVSYYDDVVSEEVIIPQKAVVSDTAKMSNAEIDARIKALNELNARMQSNRRTIPTAVSAPATATDIAPTRKLPPPVPKQASFEDSIRAKITKLEKELEKSDLTTQQYIDLATNVNKLRMNLKILAAEERERRFLRASGENARKISEIKLELGQRDSINVGPLTQKAKIAQVRRYDEQFAKLMAAPRYVHHTPTVSGPFKTLKQTIDNERIRLANQAFMAESLLDPARQAEHVINQGYYDNLGRQLEIEALSKQPQTLEVQTRIQQLRQETQASNLYDEKDSLMRGKVNELDEADLTLIEEPQVRDVDFSDPTMLDENYYTGGNKPARLLYAEDTTAPKAEIEVGDADIEEAIYNPSDAELIEEPITANATPQPAPVKVPLSLASSTKETEVPFDEQKTGLRWTKGILDKLRGIRSAKSDESVADRKVANAKR